MLLTLQERLLYINMLCANVDKTEIDSNSMEINIFGDSYTHTHTHACKHALPILK